MAAEITTSGRGREYEVHGPAAFWRNFATMMPDDDDSVIDFVRRKGDPFGRLSPKSPINTAQWRGAGDWLSFAADLWEPEGADGVSRVGPDDAKRARVTEGLIKMPLFQRGIEWLPVVDAKGDLAVQVSPKNLLCFMLASAVLQAQLRTPMARCEQCGDWFGVQRQGTRFCSPSCRAAHSSEKSKKGESDGFS